MLSDHYEVILADSAEARRIHYRLRYQVYCLEQAWEPVSRFPDGEEKDEFDDRAVHFMIRNRFTGDWIAALRVVLPGEDLLPIESLGVLKESVRAMIPAGGAAEISRVCRPKSAAEPEHRIEARLKSDLLGGASEILLRLLRAAAQYCCDRGINHVYMLCRPAMARMMNRLDIPMKRAGIPSEHRGVRVPYLVDLRQAFAQARAASPLLAELLSEPHAYRLYSDTQSQPLVAAVAARTRGLRVAHSRAA